MTRLWRGLARWRARKNSLQPLQQRSRSLFPLRRQAESEFVSTLSPVPEGFELVSDVSAARWVEERLSKWPWATVGSLLPDAFDAYTRVLHPAYVGDPGELEPARWSAVASRTGRTIHPLVQFARISNLNDDPNEQPSWGRRPHEGRLDGADLLAALLRRFTLRPDDCWFCLWDGFGGLDMVPNLAEAPRVKVPGRTYLLFHGPLDALASFSASGPPWGDPPNIWWPDDQTWCVATEIDLESTYVGGSDECIQKILAHPDLEALPARVEDRVDVGADELNI
jgi:hypothetical protein